MGVSAIASGEVENSGASLRQHLAAVGHHLHQEGQDLQLELVEALAGRLARTQSTRWW